MIHQWKERIRTKVGGAQEHLTLWTHLVPADEIPDECQTPMDAARFFYPEDHFEILQVTRVPAGAEIRVRFAEPVGVA